MMFRRHSMSVRLSLALWYIAAMVVVLALYAAIVRVNRIHAVNAVVALAHEVDHAIARLEPRFDRHPFVHRSHRAQFPVAGTRGAAEDHHRVRLAVFGGVDEVQRFTADE